MSSAAGRCGHPVSAWRTCARCERTGGHAYGSVYPGPIGAVLTPQLRGVESEVDRQLPYASSLCGACYEVCPVAINIPDLLVHLRERVAEQPRSGAEKAMGLVMRVASWVLGDARRLSAVQRLASSSRRLFGTRSTIGQLPPPPPLDRGAGRSGTAAGVIPAVVRTDAGRQVIVSDREVILGRSVRRCAAAPSGCPPTIPRHYLRQRFSSGITELFPERVADQPRSASSAGAGPEQLVAALRAAGAGSAAAGRCPGDLAESAWRRSSNRSTTIPRPLSTASTSRPTRCHQLLRWRSPRPGRSCSTTARGRASGRSPWSRTYVCVVREEQIVDDVPAGMARLDPRRPLTFISGPSATATSVFDRVEGVHRPRNLHVVVAAG